MGARVIVGGACLWLGLASWWVGSVAAEEVPAAYATESSVPTLDTIPVETAAEPSPAPEEISSPYSNQIDEITVTAQKRAENAQDVPISIAAFSGEQLEKLGVQSTQNIAQRTPGLVFDTVANFAIIYIRGVGTDAFLPSADTSVATYVDGIYFPSSYSLAQSLGAIERIEILKGPQGTLFGRNATGGAINVVTKEPSDSFEGSVQTVAGNFDQRDVKVYATGPIVPTLSGSLSAVFNSGDDYYKLTDTSPLDRLQKRQDYGFNAKLKWLPAEWLDATLNGFYIDSRGVGSSLLPNLKVSPVGMALGANNDADPRDYKTSVNEDPVAFSQNYVGGLTVNLHPGPLDLKSITAYQDLKAQALQDFDGSDASAISFGTQPGERDDYRKTSHSDYFTQEFQFLSNDDSPFADHFTWVGGFYYLDGTVGFDPLFFNVAGLQNLQNVPGLPGPVDVPFADVLLDLVGGVLPVSGFRTKVTGDLDTTATAVFLQATWKPMEWLGITLGGRQAHEKRKVYNATLGGDVTIAGTTMQIPLSSYPSQRVTKDNFSPKLTVDVKLGDDVLVYASGQKAFKSGSFNVVNLTSAPTYIKPETVVTYEIGVKSDLFDRSVRFNASLFQSTIDDLQSQFVSLTSGGVVNFENAKKARVRGAEADILWALLNGLQLSVAATYLDGEYKSFPDASGYDQESGLSTSGNDYSGNTIARNPKLTAAVSASYTLEVPGGTTELGLDWYYNDGYYFDAQNALKQPQYQLLGARAGYTYEPWNLTITAFGNNLGGEKYYAFKTQFDTGIAGRLAAPRTYGLRLNWQF